MRKSEFATEAELCSAFIKWVGKYPGWTAYPETHDWDILLAHRDGTQIGVQAKLKFNLKVLDQAVELSGWNLDQPGPDFRAVLVPLNDGYRALADALGLTLIRSNGLGNHFYPDLGAAGLSAGWHYCNPARRLELPAYVSDVPAGVPSPTPLTHWRIQALRLSALMELRGFISRADFKSLGVDHRRWVRQWLEEITERPGAWRWRNGVNPELWRNHESVYARILAEERDRDGHLVLEAC